MPGRLAGPYNGGRLVSSSQNGPSRISHMSCMRCVAPCAYVHRAATWLVCLVTQAAHSESSRVTRAPLQAQSMHAAQVHLHATEEDTCCPGSAAGECPAGALSAAAAAAADSLKPVSHLQVTRVQCWSAPAGPLADAELPLIKGQGIPVRACTLLCIRQGPTPRKPHDASHMEGGVGNVG